MSAFRTAVAVHGLPSIVYTDGFTIFGHEGEDINTAYGRMCAAFGVTHIVAPTPQAKGKIERHMRTLQHRVRTLVLDAIASAGVTDLEGAAPVIARHIAFWNENHVNRTTGLTLAGHTVGRVPRGRGRPPRPSRQVASQARDVPPVGPPSTFARTQKCPLLRAHTRFSRFRQSPD